MSPFQETPGNLLDSLTHSLTVIRPGRVDKGSVKEMLRQSHNDKVKDLHRGGLQCLCTSSSQPIRFAIASSKFVLFAALSASCPTIFAHSFLGRPFLRTAQSVLALSEPSQNASGRNKLHPSSRATLPYNNSCCWSSCVVYGFCCARSRTILFEMRDTKDGLILRIFLRHLAWNPSSLLLSAALSQAELNPYRSPLDTTDWKIWIFFLTMVRKASPGISHKCTESFCLKRAVSVLNRQ